MKIIRIIIKKLAGGFAAIAFRRPSRARDRVYAEVQHSLSRKLLVRLAAALVCTGILAQFTVTPSISRYLQASRNLEQMRFFKLVLDTATYMSSERGPSNNLMAEDPEFDGPSTRRLLDYRARTDRALMEVSALSAAEKAVEDRIPVELLESVRKQLDSARAEVDRVATIPLSKLELTTVDGAIAGMFKASNRYEAVTAWSANRLVRQTPELAAPVLIGQMLTDLRDYGGRVASYIVPAVAARAPLPASNNIASRQSQGKLFALWRFIKAQTLYDSAGMASLRSEIERRFFGDGMTMIGDLISDGQHNRPYRMTVTKFTDEFVPTMEPISEYRDAFLNAAVYSVEKARRDALFTLISAIVATMLICAFLIRIAYSVRREVFQPLLRVHDDVLRMADDQPARSRPMRKQDGEIHALFQAIGVLQEKLNERASLTKDLRTQAETDGLTGVLNRRALERVGRVSPDVPDTSDAICLVLMDLDHFKAINDTYGHATGDDVLREAANVLRSETRAGETLARYGGEEFAVVLSGDDLEGAVASAERIRSALARKTFVAGDGTPFGVTASFGVAAGRRGDNAWTSLIEDGDAALYQAKRDGRNCVRATPISKGTTGTPDDYGLRRAVG